MRKKKNLIGKTVKIISDNENYDPFRKEILTVSHAQIGGMGYDESCFPQLLCDFKTESGVNFPFSLYEFEFELI